MRFFRAVLLFPVAASLAPASAYALSKEVPQCVEQALREMEKLLPPRHMPQSLVTPNIGEILFIPQYALKENRVDIPPDAGPFSTPASEPIPLDHYRVLAYDKAGITALEDPGGHRFTVPSQNLVAHLFQRLDPVGRPPTRFQPGSWVRLQHVRDTGLSVPLETISGEPWNEMEGYLGSQRTPTIGVVKKINNDRTVEIALSVNFMMASDKFPKIYSGVYRIGVDYITDLQFGDARSAHAALAPLLALKNEFSVGEKVRFRSPSSHSMGQGKVISIKGEWTQVSDENGQTLSIPSDKVFKQVRDGATSLNVRLKSEDAHIDYDSGLLQAALNGGAKLSSVPGFTDLSAAAQIQALAEYVNLVTPYEKAANFAEANGLKKISDYVCAGVATCRHQSVLLGILLSEAGFKVRIAWAEYFEGKDFHGHRWLEVDVPGAKGVETYVVDPTAALENVAKPWSEVEKAAADPATPKGSFDKVFFTHPERQYFGLD